MSNNKFRGTGVAIVTPFRTDGSIDFKALQNLVNNVIANSIDFIVVLGTTGEAATMNIDEKNAVVSYVIEITDKRVPIVVGIGGNNTNEVISTIKNTDFDGIDAILSVTPYYNKPNQKGLYNHYKAVAGASPIPVILYNVPGRTSCNISAETTLQLANDYKNIIAIKEASGNITQISKIINNKPDDFLVLSGDDALAIPLIALGADGIISVVANVYPKKLSNMISLALNNNFEEARTIHFQLSELIENLFADGNPAGIKAALSLKCKIVNHLRLPLTPVNRSVYNKLSSLIEQIEKL